MLKLVENCGSDRKATEHALIKELFSPATCNRALVDALAKTLEPQPPELIVIPQYFSSPDSGSSPERISHS